MYNSILPQKRKGNASIFFQNFNTVLFWFINFNFGRTSSFVKYGLDVDCHCTYEYNKIMGKFPTKEIKIPSLFTLAYCSLQVTYCFLNLPI